MRITERTIFLVMLILMLILLNTQYACAGADLMYELCPCAVYMKIHKTNSFIIYANCFIIPMTAQQFEDFKADGEVALKRA